MNRLLLPLCALFLAAAATASQAAEEDNLLPVEQAFKVDAKALDHDRIQFDFKIADDYYLYRERIKTKSIDAGISLGALDLPAGETKHDEYLGDVEVYHHGLTATQHLTAPAGQDKIALELRYQGCHQVDPKICFPPQKVVLTIDLPKVAGDGGASASLANALSAPASPSLLGGSTPLPAEQAFVFEAIATGPTEVLARFTMPKGYYLYRDKTDFALAEGSATKLGVPNWPAGKDHTDANFGTTTVYFDQVEVPIAVTHAGSSAQTLALITNFQGCLENSVCYPVMTRTVHVALPAESASGTDDTVAAASTPQQPRPEVDTSFFAVILGALLGGLILNLMPCVLPVLSLKAISLIEGGESPQKARLHVLYYTAGVLVSFAVVGLSVIALRAAGLAYGWGFQLQQPLVVAALIYVILAIGLSMSGVVQFGVGLAGLGQNLAAKSGPAGDFFTGVLACVVASPCTAPFMGSALAYALASSPLVALCVFLALGLGLALPFLAIGFIPALGRWLPRPGAWMDTLKQLLAFPMYFTAAWLIWVLGYQRGVDAVGLVLVGAIVLALGLWWFERSRYRSLPWRVLAWLAILLALPPLYAIGKLAHVSMSTSTQARDDGAVAFDPARLADLRKQGTPVFVDIGADWCTTCKVNEHGVLATQAFHDLLKRTGTVFMVGDWTNPDAKIEAFLGEYHSVGVPLYVAYPRGDGPGHALPTVLTNGSVREALEPDAK